MRGFRGLTIAAVGLISATWASTASAEQVVVFDQTWVHTPDLPDSHFRMPPAVGTPADWVNPVDFTGGSAWVYLEVFSKPTEQETKFQVCFEATPTYACTAQSPTYTEVGVYEWETPFDGFWSPPGEQVDWTQGVNQIACILKDTENGKPSADNVGDEIAALYTPTEVRLVVTVVEAGSVYEPPTPTGAGGDTSTGGDDGTAGSTSGSDGDTGGGEGTGAGTTGTPGGDDGPAGTTSSDDPATSGSGDTGSTSAAPADDGSDEGGCACTSSSQSPAASLLWLGVLGFLPRRRRRPQSATHR